MTLEQFRDKYGNNSPERTFYILDKTDLAGVSSEYLIFFHNETYTRWKPPYQLNDKRLGDIKYFLSMVEDEIPFVFEREDVKYVCSFAYHYFEQIDYLRSIWGPDRPGTFEDA